MYGKPSAIVFACKIEGHIDDFRRSDKQRVRKYKEQSKTEKIKKGKCHLINIAVDNVSLFHIFL